MLSGTASGLPHKLKLGVDQNSAGARRTLPSESGSARFKHNVAAIAFGIASKTWCAVFDRLAQRCPAAHSEAERPLGVSTFLDWANADHRSCQQQTFVTGGRTAASLWQSPELDRRGVR